MATILFFSSQGSDDQTRATIPFHLANGTLEAGHQPVIVLGGDSTWLMKSDEAEKIEGLGIPPLRELLPKLIAASVPVYV